MRGKKNGKRKDGRKGDITGGGRKQVKKREREKAPKSGRRD